MDSVEAPCLKLDGPQKAPAEPPSKFVITEVEVQLACRLLFVDLEGLNDGRAVKTIVPQVNPRKMVSLAVQGLDIHALLTVLLDHRACTGEGDRSLDGELRKHPGNDTRHLCARTRREHTDRSTHEQLLDITERRAPGQSSYVTSESMLCRYTANKVLIPR